MEPDADLSSKLEQFYYLVVFRPGTMEDRTAVMEWLRAYNAVNMFGDTWIIQDYHPSAADIAHNIERHGKLAGGGQAFVVKLGESADWGGWNLSGTVIDWLREHLSS